mmetsp:Transcript_88307/g.175529  ORF Transcript_88307/g.175529 Transcript_88307/m.175529 type:complete len:548 (+) Transcript_88307:61-1704(+)|eukprot:CAMPEP_0172826288 /NCGR_PEP_ID=MMETSP1075-20121228/19319_1 /TAXON_ID=2916 /ORGANISM="Ceratium fusus, Strain PA161109" /LENGTH=547 /DNA_ID=CAMNT_0013667923 /DNA_START=57 /DNA_END=1700 /DNA_ORIENTATION=-
MAGIMAWALTLLHAVATMHVMAVRDWHENLVMANTAKTENCNCYHGVPRTCSSCTLDKCPLQLGLDVFRVEALKGGTTGVGGVRVAAWLLEFRDFQGRPTKLVLKQKEVDQVSVVAAQVAHLLGIATPRLLLTTLDDCDISEQVRHLKNQGDYDAGRLSGILESMKRGEVEVDKNSPMLLQDYFDSGSIYSHPFVTELGVANSNRFFMLGRMAILDFLEGKNDLFSDIHENAYKHTGNKADVGSNAFNYLANAGTREVIAIDLGRFESNSYAPVAEQALQELRNLDNLIGSVHRQLWQLSNMGRINFVEKNVQVLLCTRECMRENPDNVYNEEKTDCWYNRHCSLGAYHENWVHYFGDDISHPEIHGYNAMQFQLGMLDALMTIHTKRESLKNLFMALDQSRRDNAFQMAKLLSMIPVDQLQSIGRTVSTLTIDNFLQTEEICCEMRCQRAAFDFKASKWDRNTRVDCLSEDMYLGASGEAFKTQVPSRNPRCPRPGDTNARKVCLDQCSSRLFGNSGYGFNGFHSMVFNLVNCDGYTRFFNLQYIE